MSLEKARKHLEKFGLADRIKIMDESSATVELAAEAVGVEPGRIAKTLSFLVHDEPVLILTEGTARIDNKKYKAKFHTKAKMIPAAEVEERIGHAPGGVCPFGVSEGTQVYLDVTLKKYDVVYPAAGTDHSAVELSIPELEKCSGSMGWVDVCKE